VYKSHAILDKNTRIHKAKKIEALVQKHGYLKKDKMLEVGCGSGFIANYFSNIGFCKQGTYAIDVIDERKITDGFKFKLVEDTKLPFSDNTFDFIISNHVIEHVGPREKQISHLKEINRCLQPGGIFYFAVPNRWRIIEPHYRLPFLSWLPKSLATPYIKLIRDVSYYDCLPLSQREAIELLNQSNFEYINATLDAIYITGKIEGNWFLQSITKLPKWFWRPFAIVIPTLIFVCKKPSI
jgi:SAM-dependent methyltransferase